MSNPVQKAIMDRRSTRGFDGTPLTEAELQNLVDAALASPSAVNRQPWHFTFVKDKALLAEFNAAAKAHMLANSAPERRAAIEAPGYEFLMGAPLFVIISAEKENQGYYPRLDSGIAVENLALSAMGMGLGSVILGMPRDMFENAPMGAEFKEKFGIPAGYEYMVGIIIGHNTVTKDAHPIGENKYNIV